MWSNRMGVIGAIRSTCGLLSRAWLISDGTLASRPVVRTVIAVPPETFIGKNMSLDEPKRKAPDRSIGGVGRLNVIAEHGKDPDLHNAAGSLRPARRKLVTFEKLNHASPQALAPLPSCEKGDGETVYPAPSDVAGVDEAARALIRKDGASSSHSDLIAARSRQEANIKRIRTSGSIIRRTLESLR